MSRPSAAIAWQHTSRPARQQGIRHDTSATQRPIAYETFFKQCLGRQNEVLFNSLLAVSR